MRIPGISEEQGTKSDVEIPFPALSSSTYLGCARVGGFGIFRDLWDLCSVIEVVWKIYTEARSPIVSTRRVSARATRDQNSLARRLCRSNREKLRLNNKRAMALYTCVDKGYEK